jgi:hypothetical protein
MRAKQSDLVKRLGVTKGRVSQLVKSGVLRPGADGLFDPDAAEAAYRALRGEGEIAGQAGPGEMAELVKLKTELAKAKLVCQQQAAELMKIKADLQRGRLIQTEAAAAAFAKVLESIYKQVDSYGLSVFRAMDLDDQMECALDERYRDAVRSAFIAGISRPKLPKGGFLVKKAELTAEMLQAMIDVCGITGEDPGSLQTVLDFVGAVREVLADITPEFIEKINDKLPARIQRGGPFDVMGGAVK